MANWYCDSTAYAAVAQWATNTAYLVGAIVRQKATPTVGNERCFRCSTAGTSNATTEPTWVLTKNATTNDTSPLVWTECTGQQLYQTTDSWTAPFDRLQTALSTSWIAIGDTVFVGSTHAETQAAAMTITNLASALLANVTVLCVNRPSSAIPPLAADVVSVPTATVTTTGANEITFDVAGYFYGIIFQSASGANTGTFFKADVNGSAAQAFEQCKFSCPATSGAPVIQFGELSSNITSGVSARLKYCTFSFGAVGGYIIVAKPMLWDGGSLTGTAVTTLFNAASGTSANWMPVEVRNVDLSLLAGSSFVINLSNPPAGTCGLMFNNCKLNSGLSGFATGAVPQPEAGNVDAINCASSGSLGEYHYRWEGALTTDLNNYLTSGASNGTTHYSYKMVSTANANFISPLGPSGIIAWLAATTVTLAMYVANTSSVILNSQTFGFEVEYISDAGDPLGTIGTTFGNPLTTGTNWPTTAAPWTGLSSPTKQIVSLTITPAQAGWVRVTPKLAVASTTIWVDPLLVT